MLFINEKEYSRLFNENMKNKTSWKLKNDLCVNSFINDIFEENKFLYDIVFLDEYDILKNNTPQNPNNNGRFLNELGGYLDHYYAVSFKDNVSRIEEPETITGIMNFPHISFNEIEKFTDNIPIGWTVFVINPILMKYKKGSIGLFLTPKYANNYYIDECNEFIRLKTGYPLFLKYLDKKNIPEIHFNKPKLTLESYIKEMKKIGGNKGLSKLLDFWVNNECVSVTSFEYSFKDYKAILQYSPTYTVCFQTGTGNHLLKNMSKI